MKKGVEAMEPAVVTGLGQKLKELLIHDLSWQDEPTPIEGMTNVWASHASARGKFATLTLVQTEVTKAGVK